MFALLWFQERSGISPTTRTIITVRKQYVLAWLVKICGARVRLNATHFHMDLFFC